MNRWATTCALWLVACSGSVGQDGGDAPVGGNPPSVPTTQKAPGSPTVGAPQGTPPAAASCKPPAPRLWRLTPEQYTRSVAAVFPGLASAVASMRPEAELATTLPKVEAHFSSTAGALDLSEPHVLQLLQVTRRIAAMVAADPGKVAPCLVTPTDACLKETTRALVERAFRRDPLPAEVDGLVALHQARRAAGGNVALEEMLTALLLSPSFLFRSELAMTPHERASALSYFLTDGPPDADLIASAKAGKLDRGEMEAHARRLLAKAESAPGVMRFFRELFGTGELTMYQKDAKLFPAWSPQLAADAGRELELFLRHTVWQGEGHLRTLLTSNVAFVNGRIAGLYGAAGIASTAADFTRVELPNRPGLLTRAALMASLAHENDTDAVGRGKFIRERLLCQTLPPTPPDVNAVPPPPDGQRTQRERLASHSADPKCAGCHQLMDPLGLALENFDGIGRYRTTEAGKTIDVAGTMVNAQPTGARWTDAPGFVALLARSPDVQTCFARQLFAYAQGTDEENPCWVAGLANRFQGAEPRLVDLIVALVTDDAFLSRR